MPISQTDKLVKVYFNDILAAYEKEKGNLLNYVKTNNKNNLQLKEEFNTFAIQYLTSNNKIQSQNGTN